MFCLRGPRQRYDGVRPALHARPGGDEVPDGGLPHPPLAGRHHDHPGGEGAGAAV